MLSFFRSVAKSAVGKAIAALFLVAILASFAISDISNFGSGNLGFGLGSSTLAKVGSAQVSEADMNDAMQKHLQQVRQQIPEADYASVIGDFDDLLNQLIDEKALTAFADKSGFAISKRLVDAGIAQIPGVRGLDGKPSVQAYQAFLARSRFTDAQLRQIIKAQVVAQTLVLPMVTGTRVPVGVASQYATMLMEGRQGQAAVLPLTLFTAGLKPSDADLQRYYAANRNRYVVPEQRSLRFAMITPDALTAMTASDQEIAAYYKANQATYAAKDTRSLSQVVVPDQKSAQAIADRAKSGATLAAAAAPAGSSAAVSNLADQSLDAYKSIAGARVAQAVFAAASGAVVGPVQSDFGWVVAKVDAVKTGDGKSLDQARVEIATKLTADKRKNAVEDLVDKAQNALDGGSNFTEVANQLKLAVTTTPLVTAEGRSLADPKFALGPNLAPAVKAGFEVAPTDEPEVATLTNGGGYVIVAPAQVVAAAPAPLASIRAQVSGEWIQAQAMTRASKAANQIAARASAGVSLADAVKQSGLNAPVRPLAARRIQVAQSRDPVPAPVRLLFTMAPGKSRAVADAQARGFFVVKVDKVVPGSALTQPGLVAGMVHELQQASEDDYARQFLAAVRAQLKVKRNDSAIAAMKRQLASSGG